MRAPLVHLVGIGTALALLAVPLTPANAAGSALNDPRYQRLMPNEPGGIANPRPGQSGGGGFGLGGGSSAGSSTGEDTSTDSAPRSQDDTARADPPPPPLPRPRRADNGPPPDMTAIGKTVLWILLAVVIAFLLFWLVVLFRKIRFRFSWRRNKRPAKPAPETAAIEPVVAQPATRGEETPQIPARPLTDWERLAQAGDYGAAIRAMLRHAVSRVQHTTSSSISPDLTSREIVRAVRASPQTATPLRTIVYAVEFVHFAGRPATIKHYEACMASLAQIEQREAAP